MVEKIAVTSEIFRRYAEAGRCLPSGFDLILAGRYAVLTLLSRCLYIGCQQVLACRHGVRYLLLIDIWGYLRRSAIG